MLKTYADHANATPAMTEEILERPAAQCVISAAMEPIGEATTFGDARTS